MTGQDNPIPSPAPDSSAHSQRFAHADYYLLHLMGAIFPLAAGILLYGWRALGVVLLLVLSTIGAIALWRRIGSRGLALHFSHGIWLAMLLAMMSPAHLASSLPPGDFSPFRLTWVILPGAAMLMVMLMWVACGAGFSRFHPVLVAFLFLSVAFGPVMKARFVLHPRKVATGDIARFVPATDPRLPRDEAWFYWPKPAPDDAVRFDTTAAESLSQYTRGRTLERSAWFSINGLHHDAMPPLEDLVIGGHPGPIGLSSAIAVLVGGLFLVYRGVITFRVPLVTVLSAYVCLMLLPIPVAISQSGVSWRSMLVPHGRLDPATMLTLVNYELLASPLLFTAFFLATNSSICPLGRRAQLYYALLLGAMTAAAQLYLSCSLGPYVALLAVAQLSLWLEKRAVRQLPIRQSPQ